MSSFDIDYVDGGGFINREKSLWSAVLDLAIRDYEAGMRAMARGKKVSKRGKPDRDSLLTSAARNAEAWIFDDSMSHLINSFRQVCEILDLCPDRVRRLLREKFKEKAAA